MIHDHAELAHVAIAAGEGRFNAYAGIHKALRAALAHALFTLGRTDPTDDSARRRTATEVAGVLALMRRHVVHEDACLHPALQARCPGVCDAAQREHRAHDEALDRLTDALDRWARDDRSAGGQQALYLGLARWVGENLEHMHREETDHNTALWSAYTDEELIALHDALVASIAPEEMMAYARWLLPAMNAPERAAMLADMRAKAPPAAWEAMLAVARERLDDGDWARLARDLGVAPVPGLVAA